VSACKACKRILRARRRLSVSSIEWLSLFLYSEFWAEDQTEITKWRILGDFLGFFASQASHVFLVSALFCGSLSGKIVGWFTGLRETLGVQSGVAALAMSESLVGDAGVRRWALAWRLDVT
jgi:hypothetical protein